MSAYTNVRITGVTQWLNTHLIILRSSVQVLQPIPVPQMWEKIRKKYNLQVFHLLLNPVDKL